MRYDIFHGKKSVHVKLTKESHAALREKLFRFGITMQDLFQEATDTVLKEGVHADNMLRKIAKKKMLESLEKIEKSRTPQFGQLDSETLYNLLEEQDGRKAEE